MPITLQSQGKISEKIDMANSYIRLKNGWFLGLGVFLLCRGISGVMIPQDEPGRKCIKSLSKLAGQALRPKGTETQEKYFAEIDRVAKELKKSKKKLIDPVLWRQKTAASGLPGLDLPEEVGGKNLPASEMLKIFEYAGRQSLNLRDVPGGGHARALLMSKNPEAKKILEQVAKGEGYVAISITEPDHGSNIRGMTSTATKVPGGYKITGDKLYNARLTTASHIVLITQAPNQKEGDKGKLNAFVIPRDYPGLNFKKLSTTALKGNSFGGVSFQDLFIPESFRIGEDGDGGKLFNEHFTYWRLMQTSAGVGTAKRALEMAAERMKTREAFGGPIAQFTHLQQELGRRSLALESASVYLEKAAEYFDKGDYAKAAEMAAGAKATGVEAAFDAVDFAIRVHGAYGMSNKTDLTDRLNDLMGLRIADGASDVLISDYVRKVFGQEFWDLAFDKPKE